jgi:hypothetical protein
MCIILGLVMYGSRAGYFTFIVRPGAIVSLAIVITILVLGIRAARAETNEAFILNSFPHCRSEPVSRLIPLALLALSRRSGAQTGMQNRNQSWVRRAYCPPIME